MRLCISRILSFQCSASLREQREFAAGAAHSVRVQARYS